MSGAPDQVYVEARRALLDVLFALGAHSDAFVLVGALAVAPYTADADLALDPRILADRPLLEQMLCSKGFVSGERSGMVGTWLVEVAGGRSVPVDLLVPESLATKGRRSAKLGEHGDRCARWVRGLEAAVIDKVRCRIAALDPTDERSLDIWVAGPAALLIAKLHKIAERIDQPRRLVDKDALDVYRLFLAIAPEEFAVRFSRLWDESTAATVTADAIQLLHQLFASPLAAGCNMVARALTGLENEELVRASCGALAQDVLQAIAEKRR